MEKKELKFNKRGSYILFIWYLCIAYYLMYIYSPFVNQYEIILNAVPGAIIAAVLVTAFSLMFTNTIYFEYQSVDYRNMFGIRLMVHRFNLSAKRTSLIMTAIPLEIKLIFIPLMEIAFRFGSGRQYNRNIELIYEFSKLYRNDIDKKLRKFEWEDPMGRMCLLANPLIDFNDKYIRTLCETYVAYVMAILEVYKNDMHLINKDIVDDIEEKTKEFSTQFNKYVKNKEQNAKEKDHNYKKEISDKVLSRMKEVSDDLKNAKII